MTASKREGFVAALCRNSILETALASTRATIGGLTAARREMFTAARWSARPANPQTTQENFD